MMQVMPSRSVNPHAGQHVRHANFGALNSAIVRGDVTAAQTAFSALSQSSAPAAKSMVARSGYQELGQALASGDIAAARSALVKLRDRTPVDPVASQPAPAPEPTSDASVPSQGINILI